MRDPVIIIGAGIGGLSAAIHLAARGRQVIVLEQNERVGGKMGELRAAGFRWDTGPSVVTMRHVFEDLFRSAGRDMQDYMMLEPVDPLTRYFYADGRLLDIRRDLSTTLEQIRLIDERDVEGYLSFLAYAARLHRITGPVFLYNQPPRPGSLLKVSPGDALRVDGLRSMQRAINSFVRSPHLRQLLGRFATYVGASPYQAPATLNVIAHVELNLGVWYPRGGVYAIASAMQQLAGEMGVEIRTGCRVVEISVKDGCTRGVLLEDSSRIEASAVIANLDVTSVYENLLPPLPAVHRRMESMLKQEPSCSGFILLLGVSGIHPELAHHNIFFSTDYRREFEQIFKKGLPPDEPTVYVSISSRSSAGDAPPACENWFILTNAPALNAGSDWQDRGESYQQRILELLAQRGFDVRDKLLYQKAFTPVDLQQLSGARSGALYGASSNSRWAAFRRAHNRSPDIAGLYFAGGSVHPGGGVPMVTLSGKAAAGMLISDGY